MGIGVGHNFSLIAFLLIVSVASLSLVEIIILHNSIFWKMQREM